MIMTESKYLEHRDEYDGYCFSCGYVTNYGEVEPDADKRKCDECGKYKVMGIDNALICGYIDIIEDEEEMN